MIFPNTAEIDLSQLVKNYNIIRKISASRVICIVKANAYGHGAVECAAALYSAGADFFGVANIYEAMEIRPYIGKSDILILGYTAPQDAETLAEYNIIQTIYSHDYALELAENIPSKAIVNCHIKINTGMNRLGFDTSNTDAITSLNTLKGLNINGIYTHFACADMPDSSATERQFSRFAECAEKLESAGMRFEYKHASNSAGILNYAGYNLTAVRAGIILYGLAPSPETASTKCLPVMELKTTVSQLHTLAAGESVSYGATFTAMRDMKVATLTIGYGDGFVRAYSGINSKSGIKGAVYINGLEAPIIGRICMDQCVADVSLIDNVRRGDRAVIFDKIHTADRFAEAADTINYEVTTLINSRRVERIYQAPGRCNRNG